MADFAVRFNDFSAGHAGDMDLARMPPHTWIGSDVELYSTGLVGPRAGIKPLPATGLPTSVATDGPVGFDVFGANLVVCSTDTYLVPVTGGAAVRMGAYPAPAILAPVQYAQGNGVLYSLNNGQVFKHGVGGAPLTPITTPVPFSRLIRWNYHLIAVDRATPYRIWYTLVDPSGSNFDSWPSGNYLDVGSSDPITSLNPIHNALYVGKGSGWWVVTGVLGTQAYVRSVQIGGGPLDHRQCMMTMDGRLLYFSADPTPSWFNGVWSRIVSQFRIDGPAAVPPSPTETVVAAPTAERIYLANDTGTATRLLSGIGHWSRYTWVGHWSLHQLPLRIGGLVPSDIRYGFQMPSQVMYLTKRVANIGDPIAIYSWQHELDRPAVASDPWSAPIDDGEPLPVTGTMTLPGWYDGQGRQVTVRSVIIQFRKWNLGVAGAMNKITCRVDALGRYAGGSEPGNTAQWIEPTARASSVGTDDSWRVNVGEQGAGNGFNVNLTLTGVAIREVVALCTLRGDRT